MVRRDHTPQVLLGPEKALPFTGDNLARITHILTRCFLFFSAWADRLSRRLFTRDHLP